MCLARLAVGFARQKVAAGARRDNAAPLRWWERGFGGVEAETETTETEGSISCTVAEASDLCI